MGLGHFVDVDLLVAKPRELTANNLVLAIRLLDSECVQQAAGIHRSVADATLDRVTKR